ncbi:MAG: ABC transporter permease [Oligoflexia bacterium]|nr:ABC transporter permease [Oligoflexia bacterium]
MFKNISLIAGRDLRSYFYTPIAYIVIAMFLILIGWMFSQLLSFYAQQVSQYAALSFGEKPKLVDSVIRPLFGNVNVILLFVAPFITMRLLAEEKKDHTIELLKTAPVRPIEIVLGKFLAGFILLLIMIAITFVYPAILYFISRPDWGVVLACYIGIACVSAVYISVGLFWSSRTENQIVAAVLTFGTLLFFWLIGWASHRAGPVWSDVLNHLSIIGHYSNFAQGLLDTTDFVFYFSFVGFALFLTNLSVRGE